MAQDRYGGTEYMGLTEDELQPLVTSWHQTNPAITKLWWDIDSVAKGCVSVGAKTETHGITFEYKSGFVFIQLLSGRRLAYIKPRFGQNHFGGAAVTYEGVGTTKKWERIESYGPKFVENIVQAMARDVLCFAMQNLKDCRIVGHVHDEVIIEVPKEVTVEEVNLIKSQTPNWVKELLLNADGYECDFYQKD